MSAYYKKIDGINYDKAMLENAENSIKGKGDGRISLKDARNLIKLIKDGGRITDIEKKTLSYILENYNFTETALKYIEKTLSDSLTAAGANETEENVIPVAEKQSSKKTNTKISGKNIVILMLIISIVLIIISVIIRNYNKNAKTAITVAEKKDIIADIGKAETDNQKPAVTETVSNINKTEQKETKQSGNEYIVKENDNLIKISIELYNDYRKWIEIYKLNKENLPKPSVIYPGQVLKLPEKSSGK
jgi:nucleoid-associated protein YgaU